MPHLLVEVAGVLPFRQLALSEVERLARCAPPGVRQYPGDHSAAWEDIFYPASKSEFFLLNHLFSLSLSVSFLLFSSNGQGISDNYPLDSYRGAWR